MNRRLLVVASMVALVGCGGSNSAGGGEGGDGRLEDRLEAIRAEHGVPSISLAVVRGGKVAEAVAVGEADAGRAARPDTIYALASVSKVLVGLTAARLMEVSPGAVDLDADVNDVLEWTPALAHPGHPDVPVTLRQLLRHEASVVGDTDADYDTYPKPDPEGDLGAFLKPFLARAEGWLPAAPGAAYAYSNVGVALAAHVLEEAAGEPFEALCERLVFDPLGMDDTRWFFADLSEAQQARLARPFDEDGQPYEHYGFDDWPSGQLRSTSLDLARLLVALATDGGDALPASTVRLFESVPMLIDAADGVFSHSGGEAGVNTYVEYREDGAGYAVLVNSDLEDGPLDDLMDDVARLVETSAGD